MFIVFFVILLTIFTNYSLWYFYFIIELLWFVMINLFFYSSFHGSQSASSYFSFILFNSLISLGLLFNLALSYIYGFILIFLLKFGLLPFISLIFNYISYISIVFLLNYLFIKLSYFCIYIIIANGLTYSYIYRELIIYSILVSLIMLFVLSISLTNHLISFNLYSLISSSFNYFILIILHTITYNSIFTFLYVLFYTYNSLIIYFMLFFSILFTFTNCDHFNYQYTTIFSSFNLNDLASISTFAYLFHSTIFLYLLILSGLLPFYIFFIKLFSILFVSIYSLLLVLLFSFIIFFLYSYSFLNIMLSSISISFNYSILLRYRSFFIYNHLHLYHLTHLLPSIYYIFCLNFYFSSLNFYNYIFSYFPMVISLGFPLLLNAIQFLKVFWIVHFLVFTLFFDFYFHLF